MLNAKRTMFDDFVSHGYFTRSVITRPMMDVFAPVDSFDVRLDFTSLTPEKITQFVQQIIAKSNAVYEQIVRLNNSKSRLTFANVLQPDINLKIATGNMRCLSVIPVNFCTDEAVRDASAEAAKALLRFGIDVQMRKDLYQVFKRYYRYYYPSEKASLSSQQCRYVENTMRDYKSNGMPLSEVKLEEIKKIKTRMSDLQRDYEKNLNDDDTFVYCTREQLRGMPDSWFEDKEMNAHSQYKVTMQYPDIIPALDHIQDREIRKTLSIAFYSRVPTNEAIFNEVIDLRHKLAKVLGFESYAQWAIEDKMAKTPQNAINFLENLDTKMSGLFEKDMANLRDLAKELSGDENFTLQPWDISYYSRIYKERVSQLNQEELQKFFPIEVVTQGLFNIYERMLGLKFFEKNTDNKWHESVKYFEVYDYNHTTSTLGNMVGAFYLDMHPREGKYGHAAAQDLISGYQSNHPNMPKAARYSIGTMICNFPKTGCISFNDVQIFFHEFGHIMHLLCSGRVEIPSMSGFSVEGDFIETPSQMLENWVYEPAALKLMSKHIETGQPIDDETIQKIKNSRTVLEGYASKRQLVFGLFDMKIHTTPLSDESKMNARAIFAEVYESLLGLDYHQSFCDPTSFSHLMDDEYAAGYYGYKWAEVNGIDMYYELFKNDPLNEKAGMHYRKTILEPGASKDAADMLQDFLGRKPSNEHYLQSLGLGAGEEEYVQKEGSWKRVRA